MAAAFAAYAIGTVGALLVLGSLSHRVGRGPVSIGALATGVAIQYSYLPSMIVFGSLAVIMVLSLVASALSAYTVARRPGAILNLLAALGGGLAQIHRAHAEK